MAASAGIRVVEAAPSLPRIVIDGDFSDWAEVPSHSDPVSGAGVLHDGIPDTHDTDHSEPDDTPSFVDHPDIDLTDYRLTHDEENLYAYFRASGEIGRTASTSKQKGRYYVIVTIDVDDDDQTGYALHEGGYYPTSQGYDLNMEVEFYDGAFNTGHYLNHGARDPAELDAATEDQKQGIVRVQPGTYDYYSQWVWFDDPTGGDYPLPFPDDWASITFVADKGEAFQGIIRIALSPDGHEAEMVAPFRGFMRDPAGNSIVGLGKSIDVSFSLEASGELAPDHEWASDTGDPIEGYELSSAARPVLEIARLAQEGVLVLSWEDPTGGRLLQRASSLTSPDWQGVVQSVPTNSVTVSIGAYTEFFRLVEPQTQP